MFITSDRGGGPGPGPGPGCRQRSRAGSSIAEEVREGGLRGGKGWLALPVLPADGETG